MKNEKEYHIIEPGTEFGDLTVGDFEWVTSKGKTFPMYDCQCSCYLRTRIPSYKLLSGEAQSCGWYLKRRNMVHVPLSDGHFGWNHSVYLVKAHKNLIKAMLSKGAGNTIFIDDAFLYTHGIRYRTVNPKIKITAIHHFGLIQEEMDGSWTVTDKGQGWLNGEIDIPQLIYIDPEIDHLIGWQDYSISDDTFYERLCDISPNDPIIPQKTYRKKEYKTIGNKTNLTARSSNHESEAWF